MKFKKLILLPIAALTLTMPFLVACKGEPSYKVIGSAKISNFEVIKYDPNPNPTNRTSLITGNNEDWNILSTHEYNQKLRIPTGDDTPITKDAYLDFTFQIKMSLIFDKPNDNETWAWLTNDKDDSQFANSDMDLSKFSFATYMYQEYNDQQPTEPQGNQRTLYTGFTNNIGIKTPNPGESSEKGMDLKVCQATDNTVEWDITFTTSLGEVYNLSKYFNPITGEYEYIKTNPYGYYANMTNILNRIIVGDAFYSYICAPNGNRFDFKLNNSNDNTYFTFVSPKEWKGV